jgi:hypothetical protein
MSAFSIVRDCAATIKTWKEFKHRTGQWPVLSIAASLLGIAACIVGIAFLVWYSDERHWSKNMFALVLIGIGVPVA